MGGKKTDKQSDLHQQGKESGINIARDLGYQAVTRINEIGSSLSNLCECMQLYIPSHELLYDSHKAVSGGITQ